MEGFPHVTKVIGNVLNHPWMPHQIHQWKVEVLLLVEVLKDAGWSDCFTQKQDLLELWALENDGLRASCEVESEETVNKDHIGQVKSK